MAADLAILDRDPLSATHPASVKVVEVPPGPPVLSTLVAEVYGPTFEGREIVLGPRAGDYYVVKSGLAAGERVVTKGNFKLDAELQIRAKPSMLGAGVKGQGSGVRDQESGIRKTMRFFLTIDC